MHLSMKPNYIALESHYDGCDFVDYQVINTGWDRTHACYAQPGAGLGYQHVHLTPAWVVIHHIANG